MRIKKYSGLLIFLLSLFFQAKTQSSPLKNDCPVIRVAAPISVIDGATLTISADVQGTNQMYTYNWSVSAGSISAGQGTSTIIIDTDGMKGQNITATLEVGGLAPECGRSASATVSVEAVRPKAELYNKSVYSTASSFTTVLNGFAGSVDSLSSDPLARRLVILYPGNNKKGADELAKMEKIANAVFKKARITTDMVEIIKGGKQEISSYELFIIPTGADYPMPNP